MKLREKFAKIHGDKAAQFVECLDRMRQDNDIDAVPAASFLDYTTEWVHRINRGGLFMMCDDAYKYKLQVTY